MNLSYSILLTFILISFSILGQKTISGKKTDHAITLDGMVLEVAWDQAETASDFINNYSQPGIPSRYKSEVRFVWRYNIYASKNGLDYGYFNTFKNLFDNPYLISFSIKGLFYIDAGKWFRKKSV